MCFGGGRAPTPAPPPAPPPPPPAQPQVISPPTPPPQMATPPQQAGGSATAGLESAQLKTKDASVEAKRRAREGTARLKKKAPMKSKTVKGQQPATGQQTGGLNYSGNITGGGASLNIQKN